MLLLQQPMSKMMTIYMVFDALKAGKIKLDDEFTVSEHAWRQTYKQDESSMFLPINGRVKVEDLIRGVIIQSGNDATVVLAEGLAGSEQQFVDEMNEKAKQIGLTDSHFMNPHGMPDPNHYSTARDLATLAERLIVDFPEYYHFFGELEGHPVIPSVDGYPEILRIEGVEGVQLSAETLAPFQAYNKWHSDVTFRERPSIASILSARHLPPLGGDTMWAVAAAAYAGLPQAVKDRIDGLEAEHDIVRSFGGRVSEEKKAQLAKDFPPVRHPVVRTHPETGRKTLFVNAFFTERLCGVGHEESEYLLDRLCQQAMHPEWQVRLRWEPGTVAFWDNRATQHYASSDYYPRRRVMERVAIKGDRPF